MNGCAGGCATTPQSGVFQNRHCGFEIAHSIKGNAPGGNVIVTGEDFPDIGESGNARTFLLEIDRNDIPVTEALNAAQRYAAMGVYSAIMRKYIE